MKKVGPDLHIFANSVVVLACILLVVAVGILIFKHEKLKLAALTFVDQAMIATKQKYVGADATEDAQMLATTISTVSTGANKSLFADKESLQKLVSALSKQTKRDIVVLDLQQKIQADTLASNVGKLYTYADNQDFQTMRDGKPRRFIEQSMDYPGGIDEVVVPLKDSVGNVVGAVIMSTSTIFND